MERTDVDTAVLHELESVVARNLERALDELTAELRHHDRVATRFTERRDARQQPEQAR